MGVEKFWDERYSGEEFVYGVEPNSFLRDHAEVLPSCGRVLCLSEGEGRNAVFLAGQGFDVHAVDFSTVARDKAFSLAALRKVSISYDVADLADYNLGEEQWDAIVSIFAHTHPDTRSLVWKRIVPSLKKGGVFLFESYHPQQIDGGYQTGGPKDASWMVRQQMLRRAFPELEILHEYSGEREVVEGNGHTGMAYVTQFIGRL